MSHENPKADNFWNNIAMSSLKEDYWRKKKANLRRLLTPRNMKESPQKKRKTEKEELNVF